jgi:hypothetical protein
MKDMPDDLPGPPCLNRTDASTAAAVLLDGGQIGFKVVGDASWDSSSTDWAMFTPDGDRAVEAMVKTARLLTKTKSEHEVIAWLRAEEAKLCADTDRHARHPLFQYFGTDPPQSDQVGHREVRDTMVRETIAYALDEAWQAAYGARFDQWSLVGEEEDT